MYCLQFCVVLHFDSNISNILSKWCQQISFSVVFSIFDFLKKHGVWFIYVVIGNLRIITWKLQLSTSHRFGRVILLLYSLWAIGSLVMYGVYVVTGQHCRFNLNQTRWVSNFNGNYYWQKHCHYRSVSLVGEVIYAFRGKCTSYWMWDGSIYPVWNVNFRRYGLLINALSFYLSVWTVVWLIGEYRFI